MIKEKTLFVRDYMSRDLICLFPSMGILHAISVLLTNQISGAPVVSREGELVGILTERDCIQVAVNAGYFDDFGGLVVDYMSHQLVTVSASDNLMDVAQQLITSSFHRYPVIENQSLAGLISRHDILRAISEG